MPLYFLHVRNAAGFAPDDEGLELPNLEAARAEAVAGIRSLLAEEMRGGVLDLRGSIEIRDESDLVLAVVPYSEALQLIPEEAPG